MFVVVSYDIVDDRRRERVFNALKDFGVKVQYSVFECDLKAKDVLRLQGRLGRLIKPDEDKVRFYFLCEACVPRVQVMGVGQVKRVPPFQMI